MDSKDVFFILLAVNVLGFVALAAWMHHIVTKNNRGDE